MVADGVSTQRLSGEGANMACEAIGDSFASPIRCLSRSSVRFTEAQARFIAMCRDDRAQRKPLAGAHEDGTLSIDSDSMVEYATTALMLYTDGKSYWAASVGDGAIYGISDSGHTARLLTEPRREGFVNEVRPFTNANWEIGFSKSGDDFSKREEIEGFCLMTDGLSESIGDANAYFTAVWPELKQRLGKPEELTEYVAAFCQYWEDRKFSDDDKTLLAVFIDP